MQLAGRDQVAGAGRGIVNLTPAIECATPSIVEAEKKRRPKSPPPGTPPE
jgi:hypothetical protein